MAGARAHWCRVAAHHPQRILSLTESAALVAELSFSVRLAYVLLDAREPFRKRQTTIRRRKKVLVLAEVPAVGMGTAADAPAMLPSRKMTGYKEQLLCPVS